MKLSEKIYLCRKKCGASQEELASRLGVSRQAVSKWETGDAEPELSKLRALAETFGVSTDWLLSESGEVPEEVALSPLTEQEELGRGVKVLLWCKAAKMLPLAGLVLLFCGAAISETRFLPSFQIQVYVSQLCNFFDPAALFFLLVALALTLGCAGAGKAFRQALQPLFCPRKAWETEPGNCVRAVKTAMGAAALIGGSWVMLSMIHLLTSMDLSAGYSRLGADLASILCMSVYVLLLELMLLPLLHYWNAKQA